MALYTERTTGAAEPTSLNTALSRAFVRSIGVEKHSTNSTPTCSRTYFTRFARSQKSRNFYDKCSKCRFPLLRSSGVNCRAACTVIRTPIRSCSASVCWTRSNPTNGSRSKTGSGRGVQESALSRFLHETNGIRIRTRRQDFSRAHLAEPPDQIHPSATPAAPPELRAAFLSGPVFSGAARLYPDLIWVF